MIYVGLDDTDVIDSPGTNQIAKGLAAQLIDLGSCKHIVRHQLFFDSRVPYTSKNGSASMWLEPHGHGAIELDAWIARIVPYVQQHAAKGSDPGVCVAVEVPSAITEFGRRCQTEIMTQAYARALANQYSIYLTGLGGTQDGVIGALAAVGLAQTIDDGRIVLLNNSDHIAGVTSVESLHQLGIHVWNVSADAEVQSGHVDVGKHLRPNLQGGRIVLFVEPSQGMDRLPLPHGPTSTPTRWRALKR